MVRSDSAENTHHRSIEQSVLEPPLPMIGAFTDPRFPHRRRNDVVPRSSERKWKLDEGDFG